MLVAGPNLTIDRTLAIAELRPGEVLRFDRVVVTPGGKGLNVARAARALGHRALLVSLVPGRTGEAAAAMIADEAVKLHAVRCPGELRSTAVIQERDGRTTVLNEPGPPVREVEWTAYERAVCAHLEAHTILVCSGSVPPGSPPDAYRRLSALAQETGVACLVDAAGETLARALDAAPNLVTPNLAEAEGVLGLGPRGQAVRSADDARPRALAAAEALVRQGARAAVVTADAGGAAVLDAGGAPGGATPAGRGSGSRRRAWPRSATRSGRVTCSPPRSRRRSSAGRGSPSRRARGSRPPRPASSRRPRASSTRRGCARWPPRWRASDGSGRPRVSARWAMGPSSRLSSCLT